MGEWQVGRTYGGGGGETDVRGDETGDVAIT